MPPENTSENLLASLETLIREIKETPCLERDHFRERIKAWLEELTQFSPSSPEMSANTTQRLGKILEIPSAIAINTASICMKLEMLLDPEWHLNKFNLGLSAPTPACKICRFVSPRIKPSPSPEYSRIPTILFFLKEWGLTPIQYAIPSHPAREQSPSTPLNNATKIKKGYMMVRLPNEKILLISNKQNADTIVVLAHPQENPLTKPGATWKSLERKGLISRIPEGPIQDESAFREWFLKWKNEVRKHLEEQTFEVSDQGETLINGRKAVMLDLFAIHYTPRLSPEALKAFFQKRKGKEIPGVKGKHHDQTDSLYWESDVRARLQPMADVNGVVVIGSPSTQGVAINVYAQTLNLDPTELSQELTPIPRTKCIAIFPSGEIQLCTSIYPKNQIDEKAADLKQPISGSYDVNDQGMATIQLKGGGTKEAVMLTPYAEHRTPPIDRETLKKYVKARGLQPIPDIEGVRKTQGGKGGYSLYWKEDAEACLPPILNGNGEISIEGIAYVAIQQYSKIRNVHPRNLTRWLNQQGVNPIPMEYLVQRPDSSLYGCSGNLYRKEKVDFIIAAHQHPRNPLTTPTSATPQPPLSPEL